MTISVVKRSLFLHAQGLTEGCEEMSWRALAARLTKKTDAPETITRAYRRMLSEPDGNAAGERDDDHLAVRFGLCIRGCVAWC